MAHDVIVIARGKRLEQLQAEQAIVVDAVLSALKASAAKTVMFMFNTFESLNSLRNTVGKERFAFGFPAILASLINGNLKFRIYTRGQTTIVTEAVWAKVFTEASLPDKVRVSM
jgi:2-dehydropantoate 2-reductase